MSLETWVKSEVEYGEEIVRSALAGARSAREKALAEEPAGSVLARSARRSLPWAAMGASLGLLTLYWGSKRKSTHSAVLFGLLGGVIGFGTNMAFSTLTEETVRGAMKNISSVRDAHWLAKHPIDYA